MTFRMNCDCSSSNSQRQMQRERPLRGEDAVRATIRKMSNEEAERHAAMIVRMFCRLTRQQELELPMPLPATARRSYSCSPPKVD